MTGKQKIAILTGGGDCPGINAVIRAVAKKAFFESGMAVIGIEDGYQGLIENRYRELNDIDVSGILNLGGMILGTSNTANPYAYTSKALVADGLADVSAAAISNFERLNAVCLVCIGGDGTMAIADRLRRDGVPIVGVPKTIDNDIMGTDITFGFNSAVTIATEGIDRVHTTAQSHHRVMIVEVMGRHAGWIALHAGIAGGGDVIIIPEIPYDIDAIADQISVRNQNGKRFSIVVVAEGAKGRHGEVVIKRTVKESHDPVRFGGIGFALGKQIEDRTGIETRTVVMGHLQRGGPPTAYDRVLGTRFGTAALDAIQKRDFGMMLGIRKDSVVNAPLAEVAIGPRLISTEEPLIKSAKAVGTAFGEST